MSNIDWKELRKIQQLEIHCKQIGFDYKGNIDAKKTKTNYAIIYL